MNYRYNYAFLPRWMRENKITASELLNVLGTKDYATLRRWTKGEKIPKLEAVVCICNAYNIPMACFYVNTEQNAKELLIPSVEYDDIIDKAGDNKNSVNPYLSNKKTSILPKRWAKLYEDKLLKIEKGEAETEDILKLKLESKYNNNLTKLSENYQKELDKLRKEHKAEQERFKKQLLDKDNIISNLSKALSNITIRGDKDYSIDDDLTKTDMVSEDLTE